VEEPTAALDAGHGVRDDGSIMGGGVEAVCAGEAEDAQRPASTTRIANRSDRLHVAAVHLVLRAAIQRRSGMDCGRIAGDDRRMGCDCDVVRLCGTVGASRGWRELAV